MRAYRTELDPTNKQRTAFLQHAGAARWAYNWALRRKIEAYEIRKEALASGISKADAPKVPTAFDLQKNLNLLKNTPKADGGIPWMYESSSRAPQNAFRNLDKAYDGFFRKCKAQTKGPKGFPRFKSRKDGVGTFTLQGSFEVTPRTIKLPRIGVIRLKEHNYLPTDVRIISATVSECAGHWFVSIVTDEPDRVSPTGMETLGVDVGIKTLAVLSDGTTFENPKALKQAESRLKFLSKEVNRKKKGSNNRKKAVLKLARQHYRVSCIRKDSIHKATTAIAKRSLLLGVESLNVAGMMKNHRIAGALSDASLSEFLKQLDYKMKWSGGTVVKADRFYPSSKTCSKCGLVKKSLSLSERVFHCDACGHVLDRDLNAAINLRNLAVSSTVTACCPESSGLVGNNQVKLLVGQEPNTINLWVSG